MKRITEQLSSMQFTILILAILMLWFAWGILLAESDTFRQGFEVMNRSLAPDWFSQPDVLSFHLKCWFLGLCSIMVILGVNLVFCSWSRFLKIMGNKHSGSRLVMLIIHVVFGLVALGHFGSFILGYRYENVRLGLDRSFSLPEGYVVTVKDVHFEGDVKLLHQRPKGRGMGMFDPEQNYCEVALTQNGNLVSRGKARFLKPFVWKDIQVTLKGFTPHKGMGRRDGASKPAVKLILSKNPVKGYVFVLFPVMIAGIIIYTVMTWRRPLQNGLDNSTGGAR